MSIFPLFKQKDFFTQKEIEAITEAIRNSEKRTSGEIRVFVESKCRFVEPLDRAYEIFTGLKMEATAERNAVLIYLATRDHQLALFADEGIHKKTGQRFWNEEVALMLSQFNKDNYADGLINVITDVGEALHTHFPYQPGVDKNELPDDIVFGK